MNTLLRMPAADRVRPGKRTNVAIAGAFCVGVVWRGRASMGFRGAGLLSRPPLDGGVLVATFVLGFRMLKTPIPAAKRTSKPATATAKPALGSKSSRLIALQKDTFSGRT